MATQTLEYHYGKHYKNYVDTLNKLIAGTEYENMSLEDIIKATYGKADKKAIFNNAGQAWNHQFFWNSLKPHGGGKPSGKLLAMIEKHMRTGKLTAKKLMYDLNNNFISTFATLLFFVIHPPAKARIYFKPFQTK